LELSVIQKIAVFALPVLFAITLHEAAHGYVARHFGDLTAYAAGRVSLNPLRHIDLVGTSAVFVEVMKLVGRVAATNLPVLITGESGTGKTMAAEIIAGELGLDLYKIDLSGVVSKYIGETEKNLRTIFQEAERSNGILFFDEADAVFGKRSEVKDAHDRYANIEVNYLLQKMEEYEGITILASNFPKNFDDAFTRRLRFVVGFPFPEEVYRQRLWKSMFPPDAPLGQDIDFDFLSRKLKITGGNIKNVVLNAAFFAARRIVTPSPLCWSGNRHGTRFRRRLHHGGRPHPARTRCREGCAGRLRSARPLFCDAGHAISQ
jgi:hypothetical protein